MPLMVIHGPPSLPPAHQEVGHFAPPHAPNHGTVPHNGPEARLQAQTSKTVSQNKSFLHQAFVSVFSVFNHCFPETH